MSPVAELLHEAFLARAAARPDAVALTWPGGAMCYRELAEASATLAGRLRAAGVGRETVVGLAARRGPGLIVGMVSVLRAGGAWLPLDPEYPADRLAYMIGDSGLAVLLADTPLRVPVPDTVTRIDLDAARERPADGPDAPLPGSGPGDLAYLIYTSGTTGRPKGVLVTHGGVANSVDAMRRAWGIGPSARVLQFSSANFDASVCEVWVALTAGATLVLGERLSLLPGPGLVEALRRERVSVAVLPPSVMAALPDGTELPDLQTLVLQGEALTAEVVRRWGHGRTLINGYGPTETSICASSAVIAPGGPVTIGRPMDGVRLYVVDDDLAPVPPGTVGELLIGGAGVARGYHGRAELTAERFVVLPGGERVYRSGDLVRERPDGEYEFVGRRDNQVKLHGIRIEPDEVAAVLRAHPNVRDAAVLVRRGRLIGYAVTADASPPDLRVWCADRLPAQLVPSAIVPLTAFPLSPNGKLDSDALPDPGRVHAGLEAATSQPRTATEAAVIEIVGGLLGGVPVGVDDDFFALGGHSLLVGKLVTRIRSRLGVDVPLSRVYDDPTVAGIAAVADTGATDGPPATPPVTRADRGAPLALTFPQDRIWYLNQLWPGNAAYHANASLRLHGPLDAAAMISALRAIVDRHEVFRSAFSVVDGRPVQQPVAAVPVDVPVIDLSGFDPGRRHARARDIVEREMHRPFRLDRPPLARWTLVRHSRVEHELVHVEHHLVHDGWSFAVFVEELRELYTAFAAGREPALRPVVLQIGDVAAWQRSWFDGPVRERYLEHWLATLRGTSLLQLPTDRPRPPEFTFAGAALRFGLPAGEYAALRAAARRNGVTLFSVMLAAFAALVSRYADQHDFVVGTTVANRSRHETEQVVGMLVNTVPLRLDLGGDPTFTELTRRVQAVVADGLTWQDVPLQDLVARLAPPRDLSHNPVFTTMFSFHDAAVPDLRFGGLTGDVLVHHNGTAKTDLNVVVVPRAEQRVGRSGSAEDDEITIIWEYATDLFGADSMRLMTDAFRRVLLAGAADPALRLSELPLGRPQAEVVDRAVAVPAAIGTHLRRLGLDDAVVVLAADGRSAAGPTGCAATGAGAVPDPSFAAGPDGPAALARWLRTAAPRRIVLPADLADVLAARHRDALARLEAVLLVGPHPLPTTVRAFQETCGRVLIGFGTDAVPLILWQEPDLVKPGTMDLGGRQPVPGLGVEVCDRDGRPLPSGIPGFLRATGLDHRCEPWRAMRHGDGTVDILGAGRFWPTVGGMRVRPHLVAAALAEYPPVAWASSVHRDGALHAFAVLRDGACLGDEIPLRMFLADRLPAFQLPATVSALERVPSDRCGPVHVLRLRPDRAVERPCP